MGKGFRGLNFNNASSQPIPILEQDIAIMAAWGANVIRWQLVADINQVSNWDIPTYNAWLQTKLADIDGVIPFCTQNAISLIVDLHTPVGGLIQMPKGPKYRIFVDETFAAAYLDNWTTIASRYATTAIVKGYDLLNEPGTQSAGDWNALSQQAAEAVRAVESKTTIIVACIGTTPSTMKTLKPLTGIANVWYTFHMYLPNSITFQGIPNAQCNMIPIGAPYPSGKLNKQKLTQLVQPARDFQTTNNATLYVGEYSCARWSGYPNSKNAFNYLGDLISIFEGYQWNWTYHAFREAGVWELEYSTIPCPDPCNAGCTEPYQDTDRKALMISSLKRNQTGFPRKPKKKPAKKPNNPKSKNLQKKPKKRSLTKKKKK